MVRVGLTGGIGSGKTVVGDLLAEHGAVVIDSDLLAREVVAPGTPGLAEVVVAFGPDVLTDAGELDRPAMAARVFGDDAARRRLEEIVHPRVRARAHQIESAAPADAVLVHVIPLLVETGQAADFDAVLLVDVPEQVQTARLMQSRGMTAEEIASRVGAQASPDERRAAASHVIVNDGSIEQLRAAVAETWSRLQPRA